MCNYVWMLKSWRTNTEATNAVALRFLRQLEHLGIERMLHQVSILMVLQDIIADPAAKAEQRYHDVFRFARGVVRGLFARLYPENLRRKRLDGEAGWEPIPDEELEVEDKAKRAAARVGFLDVCFWKTRTQAVQQDFDSGLNLPSGASVAAGAAAAKQHRRPGQQGLRALADDEDEADENGRVVGNRELDIMKKGLLTFTQSARFKVRNAPLPPLLYLLHSHARSHTQPPPLLYTPPFPFPLTLFFTLLPVLSRRCPSPSFPTFFAFTSPSLLPPRLFFIYIPVVLPVVLPAGARRGAQRRQGLFRDGHCRDGESRDCALARSGVPPAKGAQPEAHPGSWGEEEEAQQGARR